MISFGCNLETDSIAVVAVSLGTFDYWLGFTYGTPATTPPFSSKWGCRDVWVAGLHGSSYRHQDHNAGLDDDEWVG